MSGAHLTKAPRMKRIGRAVEEQRFSAASSGRKDAGFRPRVIHE
jgi:hypothetical protein